MRINYHPWQTISEAYRRAQELRGLPVTPKNESLDAEIWDQTAAVVIAYTEIDRPKCFTCQRLYTWSSIYRCLDCKMLFCEYCAGNHFWPEGRPKSAI